MKTIIRKKERINAKLSHKLSLETNLAPLICEYLCDHGYTSKEKINNFINFNENNLKNITEMKDVKPFILRLANAVINHEKVVIYGDYDSDGICATTIFIKTLRLLGEDPSYFISNRFTEGYGLSIKGMQRLLAQYPDTKLIVTCDNGIVAFEGVDYAKSKGVDVIISDHHIASPDCRLPDCPVVCEKRRDENTSQLEGFCGAELARRLCILLTQVLRKYEPLKDELESLYAFAGFATITDVIELNSSNHFIAKKGLEEINNYKKDTPCFAALKEVLSINSNIDEVSIGYHLGPMINAAGRITGDASLPVELFISNDIVLKEVLSINSNIDEVSIGYHLGPMINAAGRITGDASLPVELFISNDIVKAKKLALELRKLNEIRQEKSFEQQQLAKKEYDQFHMENDKFIILKGIDGDSYDEGIAGLIASYIVENYKKPCICLAKTENEDIYKGSARSIEGFNIKVALDNCSQFLEGYGGHSMAAGLSLKKSNINQLHEHLNDLSKNTENLIEYIDVDYFESINNFDFGMIDEYRRCLAPFGVGFEKPTYATSGLFDQNKYIMKDKHVKTKLKDGNEAIDLLWFNSINKLERIRPEGKLIFATGLPSINEFNGTRSIQFIVDYLSLFN